MKATAAESATGQLGKTAILQRMHGFAGRIFRNPSVDITALCRWLLSRLLWASAGACAAVLLMSRQSEIDVTRPAVKKQPQVAASDSATRERDSSRRWIASSEVIGAQRQGFSFTKDGVPAEVVRYSSIERRSWTNPKTDARVEVSVPREDVVLIPVSVQ